ncbi:hypothetical protein ACRPOS_001290 [Bartonella heixiaziensis]|uniref:hypothetical protein n=1 Tax=Bartonella heixiaziensis TaxID=1461000 RepID=UPI003908B821
MDKHGRFCNVSKDLGQIICSLLFSILGSNFHEVANQFKDDRYRELSGFIEAFIPWRKQIIQESVDGCLEWLDVELSALPIFDAKY